MVIVREKNPATIEERAPQRERFVIRIDDDAVVDALIIFGSFFGVGKQLVRRFDGIEAAFSAGMRIPVRVMAHGESAVRLLDVFARRGGGYAKDVV